MTSDDKEVFAIEDDEEPLCQDTTSHWTIPLPLVLIARHGCYDGMVSCNKFLSSRHLF